jgi:hypothetical protein
MAENGNPSFLGAPSSPKMVAMVVATVVGNFYERRSNVLPREIGAAASQHRRAAHWQWRCFRWAGLLMVIDGAANCQWRCCELPTEVVQTVSSDVVNGQWWWCKVVQTVSGGAANGYRRCYKCFAVLLPKYHF